MASKRRGQARAKEVAPPTPSRAEQIERRQRLELLQAAIGKQHRGEKLTAKEIAAVKRFEQEEREKHGMALVRSVPKKLYAEWSGRQTKVLHDQARLYGLPLEGATIDLVAVVRALHDFLAEHKHELAIVAKGETSATGSGGRGDLVAEQVESLRKKNLLLDAKLEGVAGTLVPRDLMHEKLQLLANMLRQTGHRLYKQCGEKAGDLLQQTIADFDASLEQFDDAVFDDAGTERANDEPADVGRDAAA